MSLDETFRDRLKKQYPAVADQLAKIIEDCIATGGTPKEIEKCIKDKVKAQNINVDENKVGAKTMAHFVAFG